MASTGKIEVSTPQMSLTTTTSDTGDFYGNMPTNGQPYSFPFPGIVTKVLINSLPGGPDMAGQQFELLLGVGSQSPFSGLGVLNLAAGGGIQTFNVAYPFSANDGFLFNMGSVASAKYSITLEIVYSLV